MENILYQTYYDSPIGKLTLVSDGIHLVELWIEGQKKSFHNLKKDVIISDNLEIFQKTKIWLKCYFQQECPSIFELSLSPKGSVFERNVWNLLCAIPYGTTTTYGKIAKEIMRMMNKNHMSAQAIGGAVGRNPISIIIPCHRVVGKDGNLTGYAGGIDKKIKLLEIEKVNMDHFFLPKQCNLKGENFKN